MTMPRFLAFTFLALSAAPGPAADLTRIDRHIRHEPTYRGKPKYCLLVFGKEARTRIWLVQDGPTIYVDRHGTGDLTAPDSKVAAEKDDGAEAGVYTFKAGDLFDGELVHKELTVEVKRLAHFAAEDDHMKALVARDQNALGYHIQLQVAMPGWKGSGIGGRVIQWVYHSDPSGVFRFADRPEDAPVVHFRGPWQITFIFQPHFVVGRQSNVVLSIGTPGLGPGANAYIDYPGVVPEGVHPVVEMSYASPEPGKPPARERYELKQRC